MSIQRRQQKSRKSNKKKKEKANLTGVRQIVWPRNKVSFVLAWLDECVEQHNGASHFNNTVVEQLKMRWNEDFNLREVTNLVRREYEKFKDLDNPANKSRGAIRKLGTKCLRFAGNREALKLKESLRIAKAELRAQFERQDVLKRTRTPRSTSAVTPSVQSRRLRSHDSSCTIDASAGRSIGSAAVVYSRRFGCKSETPLLDEIVLRNSSSDAGEADAERASRSTSGRREYPIRRKKSDTSDGTQMRDSVRQDEDFSTKASLVDDLKVKVARLTAENIELRTKLNAAKYPMSNQKHYRHSLNGGDPKQSLEALQNHIRGLEVKLERSTKLNKFVTNQSHDGLVPSLEEIRTSLNSIFWRLEALFLHHNDPLLRIPKKFAAASGTKALLGQVFRSAPKGRGRGNGSWKWPQNESVYYVARAITGAAIQRWVFESSWPDCDENNSQLLHFTRECIALGQGGMKTLQDYDRAAHYFLLEKTANIPNKAGELAQAVIDIMKDTLSHWLSRHETEEIWGLLSKEESVVKDLMIAALTLKKNMLFSENVHHVFGVLPGTPFNENTMSVAMTPEDHLPGSKEKRMIVKFCLSPGLAYRGPQLQSPDEATKNPLDWTKALVRYAMSESLEPVTEVESGWDIPCKAQVLLA